MLLRMGFSSLEAKALVENARNRGCWVKGPANVVLKAAEISGRPYREAGLALIRGELWPQVTAEFAVGGGR